MRSQTIDKLDKVDKPVAAGPFVDFVDFVDEGRAVVESATEPSLGGEGACELKNLFGPRPVAPFFSQRRELWVGGGIEAGKNCRGVGW